MTRPVRFTLDSGQQAAIAAPPFAAIAERGIRQGRLVLLPMSNGMSDARTGRLQGRGSGARRCTHDEGNGKLVGLLEAPRTPRDDWSVSMISPLLALCDLLRSLWSAAESKCREGFGRSGFSSLRSRRVRCCLPVLCLQAMTLALGSSFAPPRARSCSRSMRRVLLDKGGRPRRRVLIVCLRSLP